MKDDEFFLHEYWSFYSVDLMLTNAYREYLTSLDGFLNDTFTSHRPNTQFMNNMHALKSNVRPGYKIQKILQICRNFYSMGRWFVSV